MRRSSGSWSNQLTYEIWTDGACMGNPGPGGWAAIGTCDGDEIFAHSGGDPSTTNNRMELQAAISGLGFLPIERPIVVVSDSTYVVRGATSWMHRWKAAGWRRGKKELLNADLWQRLYAEVVRTQADFRWVRGHSGSPLNHRCDELAVAASHQAKEAA
jgi:ribonuclease HI